MKKNRRMVVTWWEQPELFEDEGACAECLFFVSYPFVLVFACQLSLTTFAELSFILFIGCIYALSQFLISKAK